MKTDILLVTLPPWGVESPSIGLGYLDSYLRSKGLKTQVYDFNIYFHNCADNSFKLLWHVENKNYWSNEKTFPFIYKLFIKQVDYAVDKILSSSASWVGFSVVDPKERITIEVIKRVKNADPRKKIILGGPACSTQEQRDFFVENIPGGIDYFVVGEGEETLYEIVQTNSPGAHKDLPGVAYKANGLWQCIDRKPIVPLDAVPFPDYRSFDLSQYVAKNTTLVEWSRGCLGRCSFCKNYRLVQGYRRHSPEHVLEELIFLRNSYGINNFTVCDNLMNGDLQQLSSICEGMIKHNLQMRWTGQIAPRSQMHGELFKSMRQAGCFKIQIGVESGSARMLRLMKKPYSPELAAENIKAAKKAGMETEIFILVGFPGETEKEFHRTVDFVKQNSRYIDTIKSINTLHLIAGTEIYENPASFNLASLPRDNWHYLWETGDGNTYAVRKKRAEELLGAASSLGIKVQETNIKEGKEISLSVFEDSSEEEKTAFLKKSLISLQELPARRSLARKKRKLGKWFLLIFSASVIFFYIIYFWCSMLLSNRMLLGGRKK
ncbi:MAG TPA: radical SAM protein [Candidatus Omnitrophota bacterium]|nr:radical SAM protein [Candidatus Omnitrophota bacterium]HPT39225.1 radical SAM protein [Candidatus Omnitrophota bacterium]